MEMNWGKQMLKICTTGFNATSRNEELLKEVVATNPGQRQSLEIQFLRKNNLNYRFNTSMRFFAMYSVHQDL